MGAVLNILMMMVANLVGFVVGTDGIKYMVHEVLDSWQGASSIGPDLSTRLVLSWSRYSGIRFLLVSCVCIFVCVQVMFEYR